MSAKRKAGPVTVRRPDGTTEVKPPYTPKELKKITGADNRFTRWLQVHGKA